MKKMLSILLAVMMIATLALTGCGQNNDPAPTPDPEPTTRTFTDSLGREVTLPVNLSKIAISGPFGPDRGIRHRSRYDGWYRQRLGG